MSTNVEMKQNNGVSQVLKKPVCTGDSSISIIFTNWNMGSELCCITICNGNDKKAMLLLFR